MHEPIIRINISGSIKTGMMAHFIPERWLNLLRTVGSVSYRIFKLTAYVAHDLIRAIYVGAPNKSTGKRRQSICYDFVSFILLDELMKQETA